jgi:hypothetical protein
MADMVERGFWAVVPYSQVCHLPNLRLSPIGVVPQRDRRPRTIVDYTFSDVNDETQALSPKESMQFGKALPRLLHKIRFADPSLGPIYMHKVDVADGFYRIWVEAQSVPSLGVCFPNLPGEEALVAFPLALPMGWTESPPILLCIHRNNCSWDASGCPSSSGNNSLESCAAWFSRSSVGKASSRTCKEPFGSPRKKESASPLFDKFPTRMDSSHRSPGYGNVSCPTGYET